MLIHLCTAQGPHSIEKKTMLSAATWIFIDIFHISPFFSSADSLTNAFSRYSRMESSFCYKYCVSFPIEMNPFFFSKLTWLRPSNRFLHHLKDRSRVVHSHRRFWGRTNVIYVWIEVYAAGFRILFWMTPVNSNTTPIPILKPQPCNGTAKFPTHNFVDKNIIRRIRIGIRSSWVKRRYENFGVVLCVYSYRWKSNSLLLPFTSYQVWLETYFSLCGWMLSETIPTDPVRLSKLFSNCMHYFAIPDDSPVRHMLRSGFVHEYIIENFRLPTVAHTCSAITSHTNDVHSLFVPTWHRHLRCRPTNKSSVAHCGRFWRSLCDGCLGAATIAFDAHLKWHVVCITKLLRRNSTEKCNFYLSNSNQLDWRSWCACVGVAIYSACMRRSHAVHRPNRQYKKMLNRIPSSEFSFFFPFFPWHERYYVVSWTRRSQRGYSLSRANCQDSTSSTQLTHRWSGNHVFSCILLFWSSSLCLAPSLRLSACPQITITFPSRDFYSIRFPMLVPFSLPSFVSMFFFLPDIFQRHNRCSGKALIERVCNENIGHIELNCSSTAALTVRMEHPE